MNALRTAVGTVFILISAATFIMEAMAAKGMGDPRLPEKLTRELIALHVLARYGTLIVGISMLLPYGPHT